ncbi:hypothetical protein [Arcobacter roscoffensis]|uniref:Chemotaxis protein CheZ n=1 Tax=Arcobacter roscoffensis TaxID=2961520 RepID=A0ABY5E5D9_9BACT|nr:hypothetical protein [Arcobacter roscoffensis]UTJ05990.1 hypothetical protein NJU99_12125 [Arcobacter roscoffensis]
MSMSQEEIEALMNGLDISDEETSKSSEESTEVVDTSEIDELISQTQNEEKIETVQEEPSVPEVKDIEETKDIETPNVTVDNDDIDALLKDFDINDEVDEEVKTDDILDDLELNTSNEQASSDDIDDLLSQIDGITEDAPSVDAVTQKSEPKKEEVSAEKIVQDWTDTKINEGVIPLPAEKDTKVVNQLNQVANDSEEKVSQIFDVLSLGLDNNNEFRTKVSDIEDFLVSQDKLLKSLNAKFPNIEVFKQHVQKVEEVNKSLEAMKTIMNEEDMKIFEAMELMQFNDINRQKIERVMSVIRKLSLYLNNLFEDDYTEQEIAVAKHIHGDQGEVLIGEDLDKLIEEFGK